HNLVKGPAIFMSNTGAMLGSEGSFDAYIFWPCLRIVAGRPGWLRTTLGRKAVSIPCELTAGNGLRLVQAFRKGEPAAAIPVDQILLGDDANYPRLMLPHGRFWLRTIDRHSTVLGTREIYIH